MADDNETGSVPSAGRPKRQPPTLELAATNVTERPKPGQDSAAETVAPAPEASSPEPSKPDASDHDTSPSDMPPFAADPSAEEPAAATPRGKSALVLPVAAGAVAGAVVAGAAWFALAHTTPSDNSASDALTKRIAELEARPLPKPDTSLAGRIDGLEKSIAALRSDLAVARTQSDRASADINQLKSAPRPAAAAVVDLAPITERLSAIERATGDLKSSAEQQSAKPVDDTALRRTVAAALLDTSVRQGEPYAGALAAVKPLAADAAQLKPLDAFAASGVPGDAALSRELLALLPKLAPAQTEAPSPNAGFLDRLQAGAAKLVRIERTDAAGSGSNSAVMRAAAAARSNDVVAAKRELLTLAPSDRTLVQPWLDKLAARDAALLASRQFAADAMAALSKPAP
jgi:hypothetical protein